MKAYQLAAPLLALPFVAAAEGKAEDQNYKQPLTQNFCSCVCTVDGQSKPATTKIEKTQDKSEDGKEHYMYVNTLEFGDPDLVW